MNKVVKLATVLLLICAIVAGILGVVNAITEDTIAQRQAEKEKEAYASVLAADVYEPQEFDAEAYPTVTNVVKAGDAGYVVESTFSGAQGSITMAVGVDNDFRCTGISIIDHSETSGLGAVAAASSEKGVAFREQFVGQDETIALTRQGGSIDALTGATITSDAIVGAVEVSISVVKSVVEGGIAA